MDVKDQTTTIHPDWLVPSDQYGWVAVIGNTLPLLLLLGVLPYLADWSIGLAWGCAPLVGLLIYRISLVVHECAHQTLFESDALNNRVGLLLGAMIGIDFQAYSREHFSHHQSYGTQNDPQGFLYRGINKMGPLALRVHFIKGLLGFNLIHTYAESILAPKNIKRQILSGEILLVILAQLTLLIAVTDMGRHLSLALLPALSAVTFGLFLSQLRSMAEHGAYGDMREVGNVRSHSANWLSVILFHDMHFNYHLEHHLYPQCPSIHLPEIHDATVNPTLEQAYGYHTDPQPSSMFATLNAMIAAARTRHS